MTYTFTHTYIDVQDIPEELRRSDNNYGMFFVLFGSKDRAGEFTRRMMTELDSVAEYYERQIPWSLCNTDDPKNREWLPKLKIDAIPTTLLFALRGPEGQYSVKISPDHDPVFLLVREVGTVFAKKVQADTDKILESL